MPEIQTSAPTARSASTNQDHNALPWVTVPPFALLLIGTVVGFFWLWGNLTQIQTSEAWILQTQYGISLIPHFDLLLQLKNFWTGNLTQSEIIADTWGWGVQLILLVCSVGIEKPQLFIHRKYNNGQSFPDSLARNARTRANVFKMVSLVLIALNSIADFNYSGTAGVWGQIAFALITL